ncbi:MAG: cold-shock protein [Sphingomonas bacterium]|nr:cold-shock protein [Sphingomonas bacterium]
MTYLSLAALILAGLNILSFAQFGYDKSCARSGARRISESNLLTIALLGGTIGAYAARHYFRHKTRKQPFSTYLHLIAMIQAGALIGWCAGIVA